MSGFILNSFTSDIISLSFPSASLSTTGYKDDAAVLEQQIR